jgi:superfamily II DNA or RNA helicase
LSTYKGPKPREWQLEALSAWEKQNKGIIQAVPGSGKTILAVNAIVKKLKDNPDLKILIVCPRLTLIQQWINAIRDYSTIKEKEIYEISSNTETQAYVKVQEKLSEHKIFLSTFHQIKQFFKEYSWKSHEWFLIVDEMHNTTENYKFPDKHIKYKLGLSATPKKKKGNTDFNLGGIIHTYSFAQALQDKIILDPVIKIVFYSVNESIFKQIENSNENTIDLAESAFNDFLPAESENNDEQDEKSAIFTSKNTDFIGIQKILKNKFKIGKTDAHQTLVFVNRIKKADLLDQMLTTSFDKSVSHSYHSKSDNYHQKDNFNQIKKEFSERKFNVLISVGTLGEGIDFPYASHGIIASPIYNSGAFVQKVGRLLRSYEGHKKAIIYYYVPSELVTRLITDEKIEPNYFKSIVKIADENKDLYFVDRQSMKEEKGNMEQLLIQGSAYERNEYVKSIKMPPDLDSIMRFFKRVYPDKIKKWRRIYTKEVNMADSEKDLNFDALREELSKNFRASQFFAKNITLNLENLLTVQKKSKGKNFSDFLTVKDFVKRCLKQKIVVKIKYGQALEKINTKHSLFSHSEGEMLVNMISAELSDFCIRQKDIKKTIKGLNLCIESLEKIAKKNAEKPEIIKERTKFMSTIAKYYFSLQSSFLDELDVSLLAKTPKNSEDKITLTLGKDIFLSKQMNKMYAYPEDFGFSRWQEIKEEKKKIIVLTPAQLFVKKLLSEIESNEDYTKISTNWNNVKKKICSDLSIKKITIEEILKELENQKKSNEFSFEKIFFTVESIKRIK